MRNSTCREIRRLIGLPAPKAMTPAQRFTYRRLKREVSRLSHDQKAARLTSAGLQAAIRRKLDQGLAQMGRR